MKLLVDVGNTRIKWAVVDGHIWQHSGVLPLGQADTLPRQFAALKDIGQVWVSNVAGEEVARLIRAAVPHTPHFIHAGAEQCGVRNTYDMPSQLGSDRWAALIAAWHLVHGACLVVNSGTATTVDSLSPAGDFVGGLILPGVELMSHSLRKTAAQLQVESARHEAGRYAQFPQCSADALFSGALLASCGAIEKQHALLSRFLHESVADIPVVLSGGAATLLLDHLNATPLVVDNLVLQGLWLISRETDT